MNIEVKISIKPIDYLESMRILEKRVQDVSDGKKDDCAGLIRTSSKESAVLILLRSISGF